MASVAPGGFGGRGGGGMDRDKDKGSGKEKAETVGDWAKMAKVAITELMKHGPEKLPMGKKSQRMPDWMFDNDFDGQPPLNPTEELARMEKELTNVVAEIERLMKQPATKSARNTFPEQMSPDIANLLEDKKADKGDKTEKEGKDDDNMNK